MKTKEEIEKLSEQEYREFPNEQKDAIGHFNRDVNYHRKRKAFVKGYSKAIEDFINSWTKGCECGENSIGQTWCCNICGLPYGVEENSENKYTEKDVFLIAQKLWNDMSNNDTLTYNSFEEYFNDKLKK